MLDGIKRFISWWNGDCRYQEYCRHFEVEHSGHRPLSRKDYYKMCETKRWNGINRCC